MRLASVLESESTVVTSGGVTAHVTPLHGRPLEGGLPTPQVFYFYAGERPLRIEAHFHVVDQYQVVLHGEGTLGSANVAPIGIHYVDAYTPYGPIDGPPDMGIMTVRARADAGAKYLNDPQNRQERRGRGGRHFYVEIPTVAAAGSGVQVIRAPEPDGVAVYRTTLAPGESALAPSAASTGGIHCIVVAGALRYDGRDHPTPSDLFIEPGDVGCELRAGDDGVDVVLLAFRPGPPS